MKLAAFLLLLSLPAFAEPQPAPQIACEVNLVADGGNTSATWKFVAASGGTHGGEPVIFTQGVHKVSLLANSQWLGLDWEKNGKPIASGVFVLGEGDLAKQRVGILYDPNEEGSQLSLGCFRQP